MSSPEPCDRPPPVRWWRALCVLGLLAGLFGMHGLAPGGGALEHAHPRTMAAGVEAHDGCPGGGHGGGHVQHADPTCASGAVSGGPVLPALVCDPVPVPVRQDGLRTYAAADPDGARAPPSLAELQLLRI